ncbi:flagellar hook-basal body complex protein [Desulfovibrio sp. ZJ200]|uniref:flagellar hook protein FlgE n=1 Tax=Desulfovibrio sp. ZJ200 TaxID=2709792 RepID=UPI0013EC253D|nr:flagellar hook-basal body complex protein [Desulfovibrio sp. ZJ200]
MNSALFIGAVGMKALSKGMQVITNNVANVSTIGYKQQDILFSDLIYTSQAGMGEWWNAQEDSRVALGQTGKGVQVDSVRTLFRQGGMESSNTVTDMALNGKGFFQVTDGVDLFYTRAGNFRPDNQGVLRTPAGLALNGYKYNEDGSLGGLQQVQIDKFATMPAKATSQVDMRFTLGLDANRSENPASPYFSLLGAYDATAAPPLAPGAYGYSQGITLYGAEGGTQQATIYFDKAPNAGPGSVVEYVIATKAAATEDGTTPPAGQGLLMSGTLSFNSKGELADMSAFTPSTEGSKNLADWTPATLSGGLPQMTLDGAAMTINFGISAAGGWQNAPASAADVGVNQNLLPSLGEGAVRAADATVFSSTGASATVLSRQDGYGEGLLNRISILADGTVEGRFSNGQNQNLWQIPVCRFTSEDGLRREGNNLFSAGPETGDMEMGVAGTENYGTVVAYNIETSNVDMATEMVNMIVTQRGFQSNSKVVTTADQMLQKAMELKR